MATRAAVLGEVAGRIVEVQAEHALRVAIDGLDAAGKTTLAGELAPLLEERGRPVIRASIDEFHNPRAARYARGPLSAEGYFRDSFNLPAVISSLLVPLGPDGDGRYRSKSFDCQADAALDEEPRQAPPGAILLFDGIFLARPELAPYWDHFIFVQITFDTCLARAMKRDRPAFDSEEELRGRYQTRYIPAQQRYLASHRPHQRANIIIDNNDVTEPELMFN